MRSPKFLSFVSAVAATLGDIKLRLSVPRFNRYLTLAVANEQRALRLYRWNCSLSQSLQWPLHVLEVATRKRNRDSVGISVRCQLAI